ncbi:MAG: hypothetical protein ACRYHB_05080, partial [Janthinobacterium lividum]
FMPPISSWANNFSFFDPALYDPTKAAVISPTTGLITNNTAAPYNGLVLAGTGFSDKAKQIVAPSVYNNPAVLGLFRGKPGGIVGTVYNTFAPRAGFAFDVFGNQTFVVRGGYGMSYERVEGNYLYNAVSQVPFVAVASLSSAGNVDGLGSIGINSAAPQNVGNSADPKLAPPRIHNYSLGIQQRLSGSTIFELGYVGSSSSNLTYRKDLNQGAAGTIQADPGVAVNALRPYKGYGEIYQYTNGAISNYHSLQVRTQTRLRQGGLITLSYTWNKSLTDGSSFDYQPQNSFDIHADYGPASYTQPKIFVASYVYPIPFWISQDTWYKKVIGGWQVSGLTRIANGLPINVTLPSGSATASGTGNLVGTNSVAGRPDKIPGVSRYLRQGKQYLTAAAFSTPAPGAYGNLKYDDTTGPLYNNWDAALQKNIKIHEQIGAEFRAEMFNVPNHLSAFTVASQLGSSNFGQVTGTTDPRTMEFVLRLNF